MLRRTIRRCWYVVAGLAIATALLMTSGRFLTPLLDGYRQDLASALSQAIGHPVRISGLSARWHGLGPWLVVQEISLMPAADGRPDATLAHVEEVEAGVNLWSSLRNGRPTFDELHLRGVHLRLLRGRGGQVGLLGLNTDQDGQGTDAREILAWLMTQGRVLIDRSEIGWRDIARPGHEVVFNDFVADLRNSGDRHQVRIEGGLPLWLGERIQLAVDLHGRPLGDDWRARAYLEGQGLSLPAWLEGQGLAGLFVSDGAADVRVWGDWRQGRLESVASTLRIVDGRIDAAPDADRPQAAEDAFDFDSLATRFVWSADDAGWRLDMPVIELVRGGRSRTASRLFVRENGDGESWDMAVGTAEIDDLADLARLSGHLPEQLAQRLRQARPQGRLEAVSAHWDRSREDRRLGMRLADVSIRPAGPVPGIQGLNGRLVTDGTRGRLTLTVTDGRVELPELFRTPLPVDSLVTQIAWRREATGTALAASGIEFRNEDLEATSRLGLWLPADEGSPVIHLEGDYRTGSVARTGRYLPAHIMPTGAVDWLDAAIIDGHVPKGHITVRGPLDRFPFKDDGGLFRIAFQLEDGVLGFYPDWPRIEGIAADIVFEANHMRIDAHSGHSGRLELDGVTAEIAALEAPDSHLELHGRARGPSDATLSYLMVSPLSGLLGDYGRSIKASGRSELDLDLLVPFHAGDVRVKGRLGLHDTRLDIADGALTIEAIEGSLHFTEGGLEAHGIRARVLGLDSLIDVSRRPGASTRISAKGRVSADRLWGILDQPPRPWLKGDSDWRAILDLPDPDRAGDSPRLRLRSSLRGLAIELPRPLQKPAPERRDLSIAFDLPLKAGSRIDLALGRSLHGLLELDAERRPQRLALHWGQGRPVLPKQPGLRLSGHLEELSVAPWQRFMDRQKALPAHGLTVTEIALRLDHVELPILSLHDLDLKAVRRSQAYALDLASREITGHVVWPLDDKSPLVMDLARLDLPEMTGRDAGDGDGEDRLHPTDLPPLRITSREFLYGKHDLGRLEITASRGPKGLHFEHIATGSHEMRLQGRGDWADDEAGEHSAFDLDLTTQDLGGTLARLGFAGTIGKGQGQIHLSLNWPGGPGDFGWPLVDGRASLLIKDGQLLDVEPGAGRIFGLLSLNAIPRRLTLDFSDVFRSGLAFDRIEGDFRIDKGRARTDNLYLDGPAARVEVKGVTDLAAKLYAQDVVVSPHIGSSLPVAGALAAGPAVGAAVFLAEKIFGHDIAKLTRVHYRITGPWANPNVVVVGKAKKR